MSIETAVLVDCDGNPLYWHLTPDRTAGFIPDSTDLWHAIWQHRDLLCGLAHSHPGGGLPKPSQTDLTTFDAIERGLGRALQWWIISHDGICLVIRAPHTERFVSIAYRREESAALLWYAELHQLSYSADSRLDYKMEIEDGKA